MATAVAGWLWHRASRARWALETATLEIARLVDAEEFPRAAALARQARAVLPKDPTLEKLWMKATDEASIESAPPGAHVSIRPYRGDANAWEHLGKTPLKKIRVPKNDYVWRIAKSRFAITVVSDPDRDHLRGWTITRPRVLVGPRRQQSPENAKRVTW